MQNDDSVNLTEKINDFVQKKRKGIFVFIGLVVVFVAGLITFFTLQDVFYKKAIAEIDDLNKRYTEIRFYIGDEEHAEEVENLLADLNTFSGKHKGFPGSKAWALIAEIYSDKKEWSLCEEAWLKASEIGSKTYLGPLALFNAAAAAEEQGRNEQAIEYLQKCVNHPFEFPSAPRAQFNIGRLYEKTGDYDAALEAYRAVLINWPDMPVWQHFAITAIIAIEVE
jgi:tetratricopeptide (TPR) repeat protein